MDKMNLETIFKKINHTKNIMQIIKIMIMKINLTTIKIILKIIIIQDRINIITLEFEKLFILLLLFLLLL